MLSSLYMKGMSDSVKPRTTQVLCVCVNLDAYYGMGLKQENVIQFVIFLGLGSFKNKYNIYISNVSSFFI